MIPFSGMIVKANLCFFVILLKCNMGVILGKDLGDSFICGVKLFAVYFAIND